MSYSLINFTNVNVARSGKTILQDISLNVSKGKMIYIFGYSGGGKTTLLKCILDVLFSENGWSIQGDICRFPGLKMAYINQHPALLVFKNFVHEEFANLPRPKIEELFRKHGCLDLLEKRCLELSQGEKTIIAILRALACEVEMLALDEPLVCLSDAKRLWLKETLLKFRDAGGTVIMTDHTDFICDRADVLFFLNEGHLKPADKNSAKALGFKSFAGLTDGTFKPPQTISRDPLSDEKYLQLVEITDEQIASCSNHPISLSISSGEIIGVIGENGSGKSTLLEIIAGIKKSKTGQVIWSGKELKGLRSRKDLLAICTQNSIRQFLSEKVEHELNAANFCTEEVTQYMLSLFQIDKLLKRNILELSHGEKQRLAILLSALSNTTIILFDEPTYGMDRTSQLAFELLLKFLSSQDKIIIIATHDLELLHRVNTRVIQL